MNGHQPIDEMNNLIEILPKKLRENYSGKKISLHDFASDIDRDEFYALGKKLNSSADASLISEFLDIFRSPNFLKRIVDDNRWSDLILQLLITGNYTFPHMFYRRVEIYGPKPLFSIIEGKNITDYSWSQIADKVSAYAKGLLALLGEASEEKKVAFFTKNSMEMVLFDLACLTSGIINVMIPANSVPEHIEYILNITKPTVLIISNVKFFDKVSLIINKCSFVKTVVLLEDLDKPEGKIFNREKMIEMGNKIGSEMIRQRIEKIKLEDLATIMFTSGTTGNPKGIQFSHKNLVFKRFARAMALPEIGEKDVFLAYLPLFHTFGRWLEMTGSIFWGARYVFMENPSPEVMIDNMQQIKPSIFISIPKKWYQLYEAIEKETDLLKASNEEIQKTVANITGANLKWGLSAAGYLDVEVFHFFQRNGIELMSGFGMTEATGGITMTPPGQYKPDSLGKALPGIDLKLGEDGELLIKGGYVMMGYVNPEEADETVQDGWFPSGDIMQMDQDGFIRIIDRKKEIYKNIRGETIAPQKIENYFKDFEFIKHIFLVGDHKPYNTLLVYPNYEYKDINFKQMSSDEMRSYFSSVIVSVNRFLAPFERIVDFTIINRDFDPDRNELTPKGTYRRKIVEKNFRASINPMYEQNYTAIMIDTHEMRIPNWFLREKGWTPDEIHVNRDRLSLKNSKEGLFLKFSKHQVQVGDYLYHIKGNILDFIYLLTDPILWLGNAGLVSFTKDKIYKWSRSDKVSDQLSYQKRVDSIVVDEDILPIWEDFEKKKEVSLSGLHDTVILLTGADNDLQQRLIDYLGLALSNKDAEIIHLAVVILKRLLGLVPVEIKRSIFILLLKNESEEEPKSFYKEIFDKYQDFITKKLIEGICKIGLSNQKIQILFEITREYCQSGNKRSLKLYRLISRYGATHPTRYKIIRQFLVNCQLENANMKFKNAARVARFQCREGFRDWLGSTQEVAVDIETEQEYHWEDVIIFEDTIDKTDRNRLLSAIINTTLLREAVFLFSKGALVRLNDIPPGGVWISLLGKEHGKAVYRITVQTRYQGSFDIAVNVNHNLSLECILEEINWLIQSGTSAGDIKLVEDFGGYWDEYDLWSEEFIQGETAGKYISRLERQNVEKMNERLCLIWTYFIWSGVNAYVRFWTRTKRQLELKDPSPSNIIIPIHDYQTGSRIVSISSRRKHKNFLDMLLNFKDYYIDKVEAEYPVLKGIGKSKYIFSAVVEALGEKKGLAFLNDCVDLLEKEINGSQNDQLKNELGDYIESIKNHGYIPKKLYFATKRYLRWQNLNPGATAHACAKTLSDLYDTYELNLLEMDYPETRTKFFVNTVFTDSNESLINKLWEVIDEQRKGEMSEDRFSHHLSTFHTSIDLTEKEYFFLARLNYPHLRPDDSVDFISLQKGGISHTDLVVKSKDYEGDNFSIRTPVNPKEIGRLHRLFLKNKLNVQFRPENLYLIAINERGQLIGGLFYIKIDDETVHLEKIVVADHYRKKGVSDGILNEFFERMRNEHFTFVTTGFFRPEYFYRFNFKIERKYAGLVKDLSVVDEKRLEH